MCLIHPFACNFVVTEDIEVVIGVVDWVWNVGVVIDIVGDTDVAIGLVEGIRNLGGSKLVVVTGTSVVVWIRIENVGPFNKNYNY